MRCAASSAALLQCRPACDFLGGASAGRQISCFLIEFPLALATAIWHKVCCTCSSLQNIALSGKAFDVLAINAPPKLLANSVTRLSANTQSYSNSNSYRPEPQPLPQSYNSALQGRRMS